MKFRKKPVEIDAECWNGSIESYQRIHKLFPELKDHSFGSYWNGKYYEVTSWAIATLEGSSVVSVGDFVIRGIKGEFYPCKPDIFEQTYERVEDKS